MLSLLADEYDGMSLEEEQEEKEDREEDKEEHKHEEVCVYCLHYDLFNIFWNGN